MKVTRKHFKIFKRECWKWIRRFGLVDFEWIFRVGKTEDADAQYSWDEQHRIVRVTLSKDLSRKPTKKNLRHIAFHEVFEILLGKLSIMAGDRYSYGRVDEERHRIVKVMENVFFE